MSNRAIFLDRDDTLIEDAGYINHPAQIKLLDGVAGALAELKHLGYKLVVVSNQSGVARGIVTEKALGEIHNRLKQMLAEKGAGLDGIYYCPYHPDGIVPKYKKQSDWQKPNPGMLLAAAEEMDIDLSQSWTVGDNSRDIEAGLRAGCKTILIDSPSRQKQPIPTGPNPDYRAVNMKEAVNIIKKHHRSTGERRTQAQPKPVTKSRQQLQTTDDEPGQPEPEAVKAAQQNISSSEKSEQLLSAILEQLKTMRRADMFSEFSMTRLMAGIMQIAVLLCLLIGIWLLLNPKRQNNSVLIALGFAMVLQVMSLTFYTMQKHK